MASSIKTYNYALTGANAIPADTLMTIDSGALTFIDVVITAQINIGATVAVFNRNRKIIEIVSWQLINAAGADIQDPANDHELVVAANGLSLTLTARTAAILAGTILKTAVVLGN